MLFDILQHTPAWVWGLFVAITALGLAQTRDRDVSLVRITMLPLLLVALSASGVLSRFGHSPVAIGSWGAGLGAALVFARNTLAVRGAAWSARTATLRVPGSWLPLALMLALFATKYVAGASLALHPALASDPAFAGACGLAYGSFSGLFLARALSLRNLARGAGAPQAA